MSDITFSNYSSIIERKVLVLPLSNKKIHIIVNNMWHRAMTSLWSASINENFTSLITSIERTSLTCLHVRYRHRTIWALPDE